MANFSLQILLPIASGTSPDVGKTAISANHRIFWAYPAIEYNICAAAIGGLFPYTFSLSGQPSGMTINSTTGEISWTATADGTSSGTITLTVTDAENSTASTTWAISVDASRFTFFNADAVSDGTGTLASPYNTLTHLKNGDVPATDICYFRGATANYRLTGLTENNVGTLGFFRYVTFAAGSHSTQWLAYPGETPVFDMGKGLEPVSYANINDTANTFTIGRWGDIWATGDPVQLQPRLYNAGTGVDTSTGAALPTAFSTNTVYYVIRVDATTIKLAASATDATNGTAIDFSMSGLSTDTYISIGLPFVRFQSGIAYVDGITFKNTPNKCLNFVNDVEYVVVRRCTLYDMYGGGDGMNAGFIQTEGNTLNPSDPQAEYFVVQDNTLHDYTDGCAIKMYNSYKVLIERNTLYNGFEGTTGYPFTGVCEGIALKGGLLQRHTVRQNVLHDIDNEALNGNNNIVSDAEICYNLVYSCPVKGVYFNNFKRIVTPMYIYRNTFLCDVWMKDGVDTTYWTLLTNADAGPFNFTNNVIVNNDYTGTALSSITYDSVDRGGTIIMTDNLQGVSADNITTATGALTGTYRDTYLGLRGYEQGTPTLYNRRVRRVRFF